MTRYTSLVAAEETASTQDGVPHRVDVPVEMPEDMGYEGMFGDPQMLYAAERFGRPAATTGVARLLARQPFSFAMAAARPAPSPKDKLYPWVAAVIGHAATRNSRRCASRTPRCRRPDQIVTGRIAVENLEALARLAVLQYVAPRL